MPINKTPPEAKGEKKGMKENPLPLESQKMQQREEFKPKELQKAI